MIKINDNSIIVGQIKQMLATTPLPNCPIGRENAYIKHESESIGGLYIDPNSHRLMRKGTSPQRDVDIQEYNLFQEIPNLTSSFPIRNMIYDIDTHLYFGKYLRFLRDYLHIDLMSMYNCNCNNPLLKNINVEIERGGITETISFITNQEFITYKIPLQKFNVTLFTGVNLPIQIGLCVDTDLIDLNVPSDDRLVIKSLLAKTVSRYSLLQPLNINLLENADNTDKEILKKYRDYITLLIQIPKTLKKPLVVLEGNYESYLNTNLDVVDFKHPLASTSQPIKSSKIDFKVKSQLLSAKNLSSDLNLLGDRIIEYICGNAITPLSSLAEIRGVQRVLDNMPKAADSTVYIPGDIKYSIKRHSGIWSDIDAEALKKFIIKNKIDGYDNIGFYDKDIEYLTADILDSHFAK